MGLFRPCLALLASAAFLLVPSAAQTYTDCNPTEGSCPADPALGGSMSADFSSGPSSDFTEFGDPTYDESGISLTVVQSGDAPQLHSNWYIMFGRVEVSLKAAPGVGIISSFILQSDDLDEIDWEFLGADPNEVQTNYFGKGVTGSYDRGSNFAVDGTQTDFHTYTIDWTASQVTWQIDGVTVRTLTWDDAAGQYPQSPMQIRFGPWSAGDPSTNPPGTVAWAEGHTDYSQGPFTMQVQSISVQDYSTGTSYKYGDMSGSWQSIVALGGSVNPDGAGDVAPVPSSSTLPYYPGATSNTSSYPGLPSGWTVTTSGKVVPSTAATSPTISTSSPAVSPEGSSSPSGYEVVTTYDMQGFTTLMTVPAGWSTMPKSFNRFGSLIVPTPTAVRDDSRPVAVAAVTQAAPVEAERGSSDYSSGPSVGDSGAAENGVALGLAVICALLSAVIAL